MKNLRKKSWLRMLQSLSKLRPNPQWKKNQVQASRWVRIRQKKLPQRKDQRAKLLSLLNSRLRMHFQFLINLFNRPQLLRQFKKTGPFLRNGLIKRNPLILKLMKILNMSRLMKKRNQSTLLKRPNLNSQKW